jgi:hypothetical protein
MMPVLYLVYKLGLYTRIHVIIRLYVEGVQTRSRECKHVCYIGVGEGVPRQYT